MSPNALGQEEWLAEIRRIFTLMGDPNNDASMPDWLPFWEDGLLPAEAILQDMRNAV